MELKKELESLLFSSGKSMSEKELSEMTQSSLEEVQKALVDLKADYDSRDTSLALVQAADMWKLNVREKYMGLATKFVADTEMAFPLLETLSIIAHKAPAIQADVIKARGTNAYEHIQKLIDEGFVERRKEGRSFIIGLTPKFFEYFEVPGEPELKKLLKDVKPSEPKKPKKLGDLDVVDLPEEQQKLEAMPQVGPSSTAAIPAPQKAASEMIKPDDDWLKKIDEQIDTLSKRNDEHAEDELFAKPKEEGAQEPAEESSEHKKINPEDLPDIDEVPEK